MNWFAFTRQNKKAHGPLFPSWDLIRIVSFYGVFVLLFLADLIYLESKFFWAIPFPGASIAILLGGALFAIASQLFQGSSNEDLKDLLMRKSTLTAAGVAGIYVLLFFLFRTQLYLPPPEGLGDSLQLIEHVPAYTAVFGYLDSIDELLELYIHSTFYRVLHQLFDSGIEISYMAVSIAAGFVYVFAAARTIFKEKSAILPGFALLLSVPILQLYAGYIENYILVSVWMFLFLLFLRRSLTEKLFESEQRIYLFFFATGALAAISALLHMISGFLIFGLIYLVWIFSRRKKRLWASLFKYSLAATTAAGIIFSLAGLYFFVILPVSPSPAESFAFHPPIYPLSRIFSTRHFLDLLNQTLMASPGLIYLAFVNRNLRNGILPEKEDLAGRVLLVSALGMFFHSFIWNPMIGFPADWDLFSIWAIPTNLFLYHRIALLSKKTHETEERFSFPDGLWAGLLLFSLSVTLPWIYRNSGWNTRDGIQTQSEENLNQAKARSSAFIEQFQTEPYYREIQDPDRLKRLVRAELFAARTREDLLKSRSPLVLRQRDEILNRLTKTMEQLRGVLLLSEHEFEKQFPKVWNELSRINAHVQRILSVDHHVEK